MRKLRAEHDSLWLELDATTDKNARKKVKSKLRPIVEEMNSIISQIKDFKANDSAAGDDFHSSAAIATADASEHQAGGEEATSWGETDTGAKDTWGEPSTGAKDTWGEPDPGGKDTWDEPSTGANDTRCEPDSGAKDDPADDKEVIPWIEPEPAPPWIKSNITPRSPRKSPPNNHAILRFVADEKVYYVGHLDRPAANDVVQVMPIIKIPSTDQPYFGIRMRFPRDEFSEGFSDPVTHLVMIKFSTKGFTVEDHLIVDNTEFEDLLAEAPLRLQAKLKEAKEQSKLYRITFHYGPKDIQVQGYPNLFSSNNFEVQAIFDSIALLPDCQTLSILIWEWPTLSQNLQFLYQEQLNYIPSLTLYYHKYKDGHDK